MGIGRAIVSGTIVGAGVEAVVAGEFEGLGF